jgi:HD-GYP domain-containing protein (c-di-GMP phosphodiesterase class II)
MPSHSGATVDVLIGSPRDSFWAITQSILKGYYPYQMRHFQDADEALETDPETFKPIIALIDGQDGTVKTAEWVQAVKMSYPKCKIIVLHSAAAPLDFDFVKKNGADAVMHINFDREFISDMVLMLAPVEMSGDHIPITCLMPIDLRDMEPSMNINFDVYIHLPSNHRSVLMRKAGDMVDEAHLAKFASLKQQMYISKTQMKAFFEYARAVMSMRDVPLPLSMTEKFHRSKTAIYEMMAQFLNSAATDYNEGKRIYEKCKSIIADFELTKDLDPAIIYNEIFRFTGNNRTLYHDCICLSAYAAYFAQLLGWNKEQRENAAIAGLLHNIGLAQLPANTAEKPVEQFTEEEYFEYTLYPQRSVNMVKAKKVPLAPEIADAMGQHRENNRGTGFPHKLIAENLSEMGKMIAIAFSFMEITSLQENKKALSPKLAITKMKEEALVGDSPLDAVLITKIFGKYKD